MKHRQRDLPVFAYALTLTVLIGGGLLGYLNARRLIANDRAVAHMNAAILQMANVLSTMKDAETGQRGYLLTEEDAYLQPYQDATARLQSELASLKDQLSEEPEQEARLATLQETIALKLGELERTITLTKTGDRAGAVARVRTGIGKRFMDEARAQIATMQTTEYELLNQRAGESERSSRTTIISIVLAAVIGCALLAIVFSLTRRNLLLRQRATDELSTERERLRVTLASIGDAVLATDGSGCITLANPAAEVLTGWSQPEMLGQPLEAVFRILNEQTRESVENPAQRALGEGVIVGLANHTVLIRKDGTEYPIDDSAAPIRDAKGRIFGSVLVFRDASAERAAERKLQLRDAELQIINDHARFPIVHLDGRHHYIFVNRAYAERFGITPEQCAGKHIREVAGELAYQSVRPHIESVLAGRTVEFESEIPYQAPLGTRWMRCIYAPVHQSEDEEGRSLVATVTDITDRKEAEEMLRRSQAALQEADRRKDEFLATLSHELRNPLAPIRAAAQLLASPEINSQQLQWAQNMLQRQVGHMALLLDDLLDIARITQGKLDIRKERVTINGIVDSAVEAARPLIEGKNHRLTVTLPPQALTIEADPLRLSQVISNLLTNAAKYTDPGGHIDLRVVIQDGALTLSVKDDGIGIAPESIDRIFEMFSQIETGSRRSDGGLGIGLALVKGLTQLHGGTVEVRSDGLGHGSEFMLHLPVAITDSASPPIRSSVDSPKITSTRRFLIADDNRDAADSLGMLLELAGHEVRVAHSGETALSLAQAFRPDTALLDIGMPDLSGYEVARQLRREPWGIGIRLIALTGWGQPDDVRRALEAGFDHHLTKPVEPEALTALITDDDVKFAKAHASSGHASDQI